MALLTPLGSLPYPQPADAANIPVHIQSLAEAVDGRTVLRFADAATRDAKVTAPVAGMLCWLGTPKQYWYYTGSVWTQLAPGPVHKANTTAGTTTSTAYVETLTGSTGDPTTVTFTAPASGAVLVSVGARISSSAATACHMSGEHPPEHDGRARRRRHPRGTRRRHQPVLRHDPVPGHRAHRERRLHRDGRLQVGRDHQHRDLRQPIHHRNSRDVRHTWPHH